MWLWVLNIFILIFIELLLMSIQLILIILHGTHVIITLYSINIIIIGIYYNIYNDISIRLLII